jgi:hypothetical protein
MHVNDDTSTNQEGMWRGGAHFAPSENGNVGVNADSKHLLASSSPWKKKMERLVN